MRERAIDLSVKLAASAEAAAAARRAVHAIAPVLPPSTIKEIELLVSELVTNGVIHGARREDAEIALRLFASRELVRVEVSDPGAGFLPKPRDAASPKNSGWGLFLVDRVANRWGVKQDGGTTVWFEIDERP